MIRLTRQADYGILLLVHVAGTRDGAGAGARDGEGAAPTAEVHAAPELAAVTGVPTPMVSKILKTLARAGLLVSQRGPHGGYALARPAEDITLIDVVEALEGPVAMTACTGDHADCGLESRCRVHSHWKHINRVVVDALSRVTLAEMARPSSPQLVSIEAGDRTLRLSP